MLSGSGFDFEVFDVVELVLLGAVAGFTMFLGLPVSPSLGSATGQRVS